MEIKKPELLCPAGSIEAFYAAVEGGADAIYLGLKQFNARGRAANFAPKQLYILTEIAHEKGVKIYLTLNTVLKNSEISEMLDLLAAISRSGIDAVIIQDWGLFYLLRKHFGKLIVHASTQMANHNSAGVNHAGNLGFERVILARELTLNELEIVSSRAKFETEIFVHGALCYAFSGLCLLSSFVGGRGANRGLCAQPCRRAYKTDKEEAFFFSLKDNEQISLVPKFSELGVSSLKLEGRMKPASYVFRVASAYRMAIDSPERINEAKEILRLDMGREKTGYFMAGNVKDAITKSPNTGFFLGKVVNVKNGKTSFRSTLELNHGYRLFFRKADTSHIESTKLVGQEIEQNGDIVTYALPFSVKRGDSVYLASMKERPFSSKLPERQIKLGQSIPHPTKNRMISALTERQQKQRQETLFVRIDSGDWLRKLRMEEVDNLVIKVGLEDLKKLPLEAPFMVKNCKKIWFELPKFIPETELKLWQQLADKIYRKGYTSFMLGHLSQKEILPAKARFATNENVYVYNDAAAKLMRDQRAQFWIYPLENDMENLLAGNDRSGMVNMYFFPELFYSRMPVKIAESKDTWFEDELGQKFQKRVREGMTIIIPEKPVCLFQYKEKLKKAGFSRFMIDLSHISPSKHILKRLTNKLNFSEQVQPSVTFNFKKGMV